MTRIIISGNSTRNSEEIKFLCFSFTGYGKTTQFLLSCLGLFILYLIYGFIQELIFTIDGFKSFGWFLTLVQFSFYMFFGLLERKIELKTKNRMEFKRCIPFRTYIVLAALTLGTMGFSNSSLGFLNYPTQVIFKCCKLIPVLIGGILIQGKKYGPLDFFAAFLMCVGLAWFTVADSHLLPNFNVMGVLMISAALLCDAAIGNVQEKAIREYHASNSEVILFSYGLGFCYLFLILLTTGNFFDGLNFFLKHPLESFGYSFIFSSTGYLGIQFVLILVRSSGALVAASVTTARKAVTIALSFLLFDKPFSIQYIWSGLVVVLGIYLNVYNKNNKLSLQKMELKLQNWLHLLNLSAKNSERKPLMEV